MCSAHISTLPGTQGTNPEIQGASPFSLLDKCPVHYTTHRTYSFTSHPKDEAIIVKCLAQGHKCRDRKSVAKLNIWTPFFRGTASVAINWKPL